MSLRTNRCAETAAAVAAKKRKKIKTIKICAKRDPKVHNNNIVKDSEHRRKPVESQAREEEKKNDDSVPNTQFTINSCFFTFYLLFPFSLGFVCVLLVKKKIFFLFSFEFFFCKVITLQQQWHCWTHNHIRRAWQLLYERSA